MLERSVAGVKIGRYGLDFSLGGAQRAMGSNVYANHVIWLLTSDAGRRVMLQQVWSDQTMSGGIDPCLERGTWQIRGVQILSTRSQGA